MSSRIAIISGSRWLSTGAAIARITRGDDRARARPEQAAVPSVDGSRSGAARAASRIFSTASTGSGRERRARIAAAKPARSIAAFSPAMPNPVVTARASGVSRCCSASASAVASGADELDAARGTALGATQATARMAPAGAGTERRIDAGRRPGEHRESLRHGGRQLGELRAVGARFLHADDVGMRGQPRDGVRRQVDAGERRIVVEEDRNRAGVRDRGVVAAQGGDRRRARDRTTASARGPRRRRAAAARRAAAIVARVDSRPVPTMQRPVPPAPPAAPPRSRGPLRRRRATAPRRWCRARRRRRGPSPIHRGRCW